VLSIYREVIREITLVQAGQFEEASALEGAAVDPGFREVQRLVGLISEAAKPGRRTDRIHFAGQPDRSGDVFDPHNADVFPAL